MRRLFLLALSIATLAACERGEDHHLYVRDGDGQRLAATFMAETTDYRCEDLEGHRLDPAATPVVPVQIFCRHSKRNVDLHARFALHEAEVTVYSTSTIGHRPGYDAVQLLEQKFREVAGPDHVTVRLGPTD